MPKLAQILEQSFGTRQVCVSVFFLFWSSHKTNRFHVAVGLCSNTSQRTSKCGKNISDTLACGSCATSLFLPHFESSEQTHGNIPCEQRLYFHCVSCRAKSSLRRQPFNFLSCMREIFVTPFAVIKWREFRGDRKKLRHLWSNLLRTTHAML